MSQIEPWRDLMAASYQGVQLADGVRDLAKPIFDRLAEIDANADMSTDYAADTAWCRQVNVTLVEALIALQALRDSMRKEWR